MLWKRVDTTIARALSCLRRFYTSVSRKSRTRDQKTVSYRVFRHSDDDFPFRRDVRAIENTSYASVLSYVRIRIFYGRNREKKKITKNERLPSVHFEPRLFFYQIRNAVKNKNAATPRVLYENTNERTRILRGYVQNLTKHNLTQPAVLHPKRVIFNYPTSR